MNSISATLEVQEYFSENILEVDDLKSILGEIKLLRVDIPFTYYMESEEEFSSYENIYKIFAYVYNKKKNGARAKGYIDVMDEKYETVVYSDNGATGKSANNKLMIYNQYENLRNKLDLEVFEETCDVYKGLPNRIRMEVSKRINLRISFNSESFSNFNILEKYFNDYKEYILDNILKKEIIGELYNLWSEELAEVLIEARALGNFNYEVFILQNISNIYDYEILRRALGIGIENFKTRESAVTKVRKILIVKIYIVNSEYKKTNKSLIRKY